MRWVLLCFLLALPARAGAATAETMPHAHRAPVLALAMAGPRIVAVGERGHILTSDNGGRQWTQKTVPTRATLTCVAFADDQLGWAAGHFGTLLKTVDGGQSWVTVPIGDLSGNSFLTLHFASPAIGFAAGSYGLLLRTEDGGDSWQRHDPLGEELHFNRIASAPGGKLHAVIETGILLSSDDLGLSWDEYHSPYGGSLFGILPLDREGAIVHGLRGHLFRGSPMSGRWQRMALPSETLLMDAILLPDGRLLVSGMGPEYFIGASDGNGLASWAQESVEGTSALLALPDGTVIAGGLNGVFRIEPPAP